MRIRLKWLSVLLIIAVATLASCSGPEDQPSPTPNPISDADAQENPVSAATPVPEPTEVPPTRLAPTEAAPPTDEPEPTSAATEAVDPAAVVVLEMIALVNAGDYAGAAELVSDDMMSYFIGMPPTGMEIYWGKEQFQTFLEQCCTEQHFEWQFTPERVEDGVVYGEALTWMDFTRELGVAPNAFNELYVVKDGKITLYTSTMTEAALAKFRPALSAVMPELFAVPPQGEEAPVSEINVTFADASCAYDGPMNVQSGPLKVNVEVQDEGWEKYALSFFTLEPFYDLIDLMASTWRPNPPDWTDMIYLIEFDPGDSETFEMADVAPGMLYMVCWAGTPDTPIGNAGPFYVLP